MKIQRVYLDTSVIGGCFDDEFHIWSNGLMHDFLQGNFSPIVSELVATEIKDAPETVKEKFADLLSLSPEFLQTSDLAVELADLYQKRKILTQNITMMVCI